MFHTAIGVVVPFCYPLSCSSCGTSWRRQDSNLRLRGYEPRGLTELPYSAPAPSSSGSQPAHAAEVDLVYLSDRDARSDAETCISFR